MDELYTVKEVGEKLKMHRNKIIKLISSGELKAYKIGKSYRIKRSDLDSLIKTNIVK